MELVHTNADGNIKYFTSMEFATTRQQLLNADTKNGTWKIEKANNGFFYIQLEKIEG
jgi:hypothetical protein